MSRAKWYPGRGWGRCQGTAAALLYCYGKLTSPCFVGCQSRLFLTIAAPMQTQTVGVSFHLARHLKVVHIFFFFSRQGFTTSPDWPRSCYAEQAWLKLRYLPVSNLQSARTKVYATTPRISLFETGSLIEPRDSCLSPPLHLCDTRNLQLCPVLYVDAGYLETELRVFMLA